MLKVIKQKINTFLQFVASVRQTQTYTPTYRLVEINNTDTDEYIVTIKVVNKNAIFQTRPEEILANDDLVNQFSPCDVRALTYIGYLMINSPKYKILAQHLSEQHDKVLFALRKKGEKSIITKTADEIMKETDILNNLIAKDAQTIGYTIATENLLHEKKTRESLKANLLEGDIELNSKK